LWKGPPRGPRGRPGDVCLSKEENLRRALPLLSIVLLGGCAGYAADYWKPKANLIAPQLARYGFTGTQGQCVEQGLTKALTVWQLRQLGDLAGRLAPGGANPTALGPREFLNIAGLVENAKVLPETRKVLESCEVAAAATSAAATGATPGGGAAGGAPAAAGSNPLWVNLGAAQTGQGIAVDAASVTRGEGWRQAWFRLLNSDQSNVGDIGYLLRIDCAAKAITASAGRKYAPGGALVEQKEYDKPEGPMGIETGTVMEVAFHALCDDPR
jgi:hypothetical protein